MTQVPDSIEIGSVISVNPARRELRIKVEPAHEYQFNDLKWIRLRLRERDEVRYRVAGLKAIDIGVCATLAAGVLRESIAGLRGARVVLQPEEYVAPPVGSLPLSQIVGFELVDPAGHLVGVVTDVFATPAHDVLEIERTEGGVVLVPGIEEVVTGLDWERKRLMVNDLTPFSVEE